MSSQDGPKFGDAQFGDNALLVKLLAQARAGNAEAAEQLFRQLYPYLLLCARQELDSELRTLVRESDLVQQSCLEAHRDFPHFHGQDVQALFRWLETILQANVADLRRRCEARRQRGADISLDDSQSNQAQELKNNLQDPSEPAHLSGLTGSTSTDWRLEQALSQLPEEYRKVILLHHRDRLSFVEIGERTERSVDAVRMCWSRAVKRLQEELSRGKG